jgi:hypothetical protein
VVVDRPNQKKVFRLQSFKLEPETIAALAGTVFSAILLVLTAVNAGPLWRDESNTINLAQMPSLHEFWQYMPFESFPPLWPLLLRGYSLLGLADSDASIRVLGLYVGICILGSLWLCARWIGCRAPILSIGLLGCLPAFIFIAGANRAYGLATCLLVLSFGAIWRVVEQPSRGQVLTAGVTCLLFAQCVYYDIVFLAAMLAGAGLVTIRRRRWKSLGMLTVIGVVSAVSLLIYLPVVRRGSAYVPLMQNPKFSMATLWDKLKETVSAWSTGGVGHSGPEIWFWIVLVLGGTVAALLVQRTGTSGTSSPDVTAESSDQKRADLALYCAVSMLVGVVAIMTFFYRLHYYTQSWYYIEMLFLCSLSLDGLLGANWPALRPWGLLRIGSMAVLMAWCAGAAWYEAHTRRSNVDLIAAALGKTASEGDLIVVQTAFEGITFNRYYRGQAHWVTVPPINSHQVHRNDLVLEKMNEPEPMVPILNDITNTLQAGHKVWMVGVMISSRPDSVRIKQSDKRLISHLYYWNAQVSSTLMDHCIIGKDVEIPAGQPVSYFENLPVSLFSGYRSTDALTNSVSSSK